MKRALAVLLAFIVAPTVSAQDDEEPHHDGGFIDFDEDAAAPHDLVAIRWHGADGRIDVELAAALDPDAGLTVILYTGTPGAANPDQATILHTGPGGNRILNAQNSSAPDEVTVTQENATVSFVVSSWDAPCAFAVARTVTYPVEGQNVEDRIGVESIADAWNEGTTCNLDISGAVDDAGETGAPGPGMVALLVALGGFALARRRTQR